MLIHGVMQSLPLTEGWAKYGPWAGSGPGTMLHPASECLQELGIAKIQDIESSHICQYTAR